MASRITLPRHLANTLKHVRLFMTTPTLRAGHNKWSKTKHIKAVTDKKKMTERTTFVKNITLYSRMYGENIQFNPQLANAITLATRASVPKSLIESAIARGQGRSTTGVQLESLTFEALIPPNIAIIAEADTDNKSRTLSDLKISLRKWGGVTSATAFYFARKGRAVFKPKEDGPTLSDMLEEAIEHEGVEDVQELPDGGFLVSTTPAQTIAITQTFATKFGLDILESDIIQAANEETVVAIDSPDSADGLANLLSAFAEFPEVKAIYANIQKGTISDDQWDKIDRHLYA